MNKKILTGLIWILMVWGDQALASVSSSSCGDGEAKPPAYDLTKHRDNINTVALMLYEYLEANVERVAIVSRAGGDISGEDFSNPSKQKYTHAGLVWKSSEDGKWRFNHVLNVCAGAGSDIFIQSLAQFFNDDPHFYDFAVGVPSVDLQHKIADLIEKDEATFKGLHNPVYSNVAYPFSLKYQNSNGFILNVMAAAESGLTDMREVMEYYQRMNFQPSQVAVGFFRQLGAGFVANAHMDDHPSDLDGEVDFVSAESLYGWLDDRGALLARVDLCHPSGCNIPLLTLNN